MAFTRDRIKASQEHGVRQMMRQIVEDKATNLNYDQLAQEVVLGKLGSDIYNLAKKIAPLQGMWASENLGYVSDSGRSYRHCRPSHRTS